MSSPKKRQKYLMLIGKSGAGKTTLCQRIKNEELRYSKTQTINISGGNLIDTPGEYLENRRMQSALIVTSVEADVIAFIQEAADQGVIYPEAYASAFSKPVVGIVTKTDIASSESVRRAGELLIFAGAKEVFEISSITGKGIEALLEYLNEHEITAWDGEK